MKRLYFCLQSNSVINSVINNVSTGIKFNCVLNNDVNNMSMKMVEFHDIVLTAQFLSASKINLLDSCLLSLILSLKNVH